MSQTNDIHPQLGAPPSPMTEEGTTGVPAAEDLGTSSAAVDDDLSSPADSAGEDDFVDFGATADEEPDELGGFVIGEEDDPAAPEQVATEEYSVLDEVPEDPTPADVPVILQDDGTGVEDADVETSVDDVPPEAAAAPAAADTDYSIGHVFDQTNGVIEAVDGESDGTAAGDELSAADRAGQNQPNPVGQQDAFAEDHYGADDGRDPNP